MESGLRRVGTQDGQVTLSGWWCRKRLWKKRRIIHLNRPATIEKVVTDEDSKELNWIKKIALPSYLHVCVVSGMEGLIQRCRTLSLTAICVVALRMHDPLIPANVVEVHPHVNLPTQRPLDGLCCRCNGRGSSSSYSHPLHSVPFAASTMTVTADSVHSNILRALHSMNETVGCVALLRQVMFGEDDHHDPVCGWMVCFSLPKSQIH